jgi:hypothetical protein
MTETDMSDMIEETGTTMNGSGEPTPIPENEAREQTFVRLAVARVSSMKAKVRLIKSLANYPHTEAQAAKIVAEFKKMSDDVEDAFSRKVESDEFKF